MDTREKIARKIAIWMRYSFDGLVDHSVVDRGFPEWLDHYQGGKPDLLRLADSILDLTNGNGETA